MTTTTKKHSCCWTQTDEEHRLCSEWLKDPLRNPETGRTIKRNGTTYTSWQQRCKDCGLPTKPQVSKTEMTWHKKQVWLQNPTINPETGKTIKEGGRTYNRLHKQAKKTTEPTNTCVGEYYMPDKDGMVPCTVYKGTTYVVRKVDNDDTGQRRKVFGKLNKPVKRVKLCFYTDTFDYKHGLYHPVYLDKRPSRKTSMSSTSTATKSPENIVDTLVDLFVGGDLDRNNNNKRKKQQSKDKPKYIVDTIVDLFVETPQQPQRQQQRQRQ